MTAVDVDTQRRLLAVPCPWCGAPVGAFCRSAIQRRRRGWNGAPEVLTNLPGASHEARWERAGLVAVSC